jgi:hypothetical protein
MLVTVNRRDEGISSMAVGSTRLRGGETVKAAAWNGVLNTVLRSLMRSK